MHTPEKYLNYMASGLFGLAIAHTFCVGFFKKQAFRAKSRLRSDTASKLDLYLYQFYHICSEVELVFILWAIPVLFIHYLCKGPKATLHYCLNELSFEEPLFVFIIMTIAASRPLLQSAERCLQTLMHVAGGSICLWWLFILIGTPLLGSLITEPAAMTIAASLLAKRFFPLHPSKALGYATLGLLFVNISIGGTLTQFAAPPILMIAKPWNWTSSFTFLHIGWKALFAILSATYAYYLIFQKKLKALNHVSKHMSSNETSYLPLWITWIHVLFLGWTVYNIHNPFCLITGLILFLGFTYNTRKYQPFPQLYSPLLVALFLTGLVIHGGLQQWWITPLIGNLQPLTLFAVATALTSFNDNAAITYLASQVPSFKSQLQLQLAITQGAVTGGGLTVIANAPNPAGQAILSKFFGSGISAVYLFLGALLPTCIAAFWFLCTPL